MFGLGVEAGDGPNSRVERWKISTVRDALLRETQTQFDIKHCTRLELRNIDHPDRRIVAHFQLVDGRIAWQKGEVNYRFIIQAYLKALTDNLQAIALAEQSRLFYAIYFRTGLNLDRRCLT